MYCRQSSCWQFNANNDFKTFAKTWSSTNCFIWRRNYFNGDPSGKDSTRKIILKKTIKNNILGIKDNFKKLLIRKKNKAIFVNNENWLGKLNYINFLREVGSHFTVNKMLTFDSVKIRLERQQSRSYMEFNYMILQAYDFFQLNKKYNCSLQLGGSDQ